MVEVAIFGSLNTDVVMRVDAFPEPGETVMAATVSRSLGGKGANQAVAAARAGASVAFSGMVGADEEGRTLLSALKAEGIDCDGVTTQPTQPTGVAFISVDLTGENRIILVSGANASAAPRLLPARVYLTQLEVPLAAVELFLMDRPPGSISILNAAPYQAAAIPLLTKADIVVVNETELAGYCNATVPRTSQEASAMARSLRRNRQTIIVTLGAHGSVTVGADEKVQTGFPAKVADTTGAGDCFCGYLAARLAQGAPMWNATETAHRAAALSVASSGAMMSFPRLAELI